MTCATSAACIGCDSGASESVGRVAERLMWRAGAFRLRHRPTLAALAERLTIFLSTASELRFRSFRHRLVLHERGGEHQRPQSASGNLSKDRESATAGPSRPCMPGAAGRRLTPIGDRQPLAGIARFRDAGSPGAIRVARGPRRRGSPACARCSTGHRRRRRRAARRSASNPPASATGSCRPPTARAR